MLKKFNAKKKLAWFKFKKQFVDFKMQNVFLFVDNSSNGIMVMFKPILFDKKPAFLSYFSLKFFNLSMIPVGKLFLNFGLGYDFFI